jgi:hypothetical protein
LGTGSVFCDSLKIETYIFNLSKKRPPPYPPLLLQPIYLYKVQNAQYSGWPQSNKYRLIGIVFYQKYIFADEYADNHNSQN